MKSIVSIVLAFFLLNLSNVNAQTKTNYQLRVGKLIIPLRVVKGPTNYYRGRIEVYKDDVIGNLREEITKLNKETPIYGDKLLVYFSSHLASSGNNTVSYTLDLKKGAKIPEDVIKTITEKLEPRDNISFQSTGSDDTIALSNVSIYIKDPSQTYRPPKYPAFSTDNNVYSFQIVGGLKRTLLKVDTTVRTNDKLVSIYSNKDKFDMVHMPGYRTKNRFVKITDTYWPEEELENTVNFSKKNLKPYYPYPEIAVENESTCNMKWGRLVASPVSSNNSPENFNNNINLPLEFTIPNTKVNLYQFEIVVVPDIGETIKYVCDNITQPEVQEVLKQVENHTTIYFQNFMVKDDAGKLFYMPMVFAFPVASK